MLTLTWLNLERSKKRTVSFSVGSVPPFSNIIRKIRIILKGKCDTAANTRIKFDRGVLAPLSEDAFLGMKPSSERINSKNPQVSGQDHSLVKLMHCITGSCSYPKNKQWRLALRYRAADKAIICSDLFLQMIGILFRRLTVVLGIFDNSLKDNHHRKYRTCAKKLQQSILKHNISNDFSNLQFLGGIHHKRAYYSTCTYYTCLS